jgi:hypothetical protein
MAAARYLAIAYQKATARGRSRLAATGLREMLLANNVMEIKDEIVA